MPLTIPGFHTNTPLDASFDKDIRNLHLIDDYDAESADGKPEKWRYQLCFFSHNRVMYAIHGGRAGQLRTSTPARESCGSATEETGTIMSQVLDIKQQKLTTMTGFSKGHWEHPVEAYGDKRNTEDFARWRRLADYDNQKDRLLLCEQANILE